jgi:uncharacterized protein (DUF488 family)
VTVYTIGHSTRSVDDFVALLKAHGVGRLADIRTMPGSRRHPHFARAALQQSLAEAGIDYRHFAALGGLRKPRPDSRNGAWRQAGFRGYADYMETPGFDAALSELIGWARAPYLDRYPNLCLSPSVSPCVSPEVSPNVSKNALEAGRTDEACVEAHRADATAIMCAEAVWWRCHRQLTADALVARGVEVRHIMSGVSAPIHRLTEFAHLEAGRITYPGSG